MSFNFKTIAVASLLVAAGSVAFAQTSTRTGFSTPVYSVERSTSYSSNQRNFDNATTARLQDLNAGRNFYNDRQSEVRTTVDTHTVGGSFMGFGASHSRTGEATQRSAAEDALHTYDRTAHLRDLSRRAGNSK